MDVTLFSLTEEREKILDLIDWKLIEIINGLNTFSFNTINDKKFPIDKKKRVIFKDKHGVWREFIIETAEIIHSSEGIIVSAIAEDSITETRGDYIEDRRPTKQTCAGALKIALETTRWEVGHCDDLGLNTTSFYRCSAHEAIAKILEVWEGEIRTRVEISGNKVAHRYVDIFKRRGKDNGKRFEWKKDIIDISRNISDQEIKTALYGYGNAQEIGEGFSRRIDIKELTNGKGYVENNNAKNKYGPINSDGTRRHIFGKFEFDSDDPEEVLQEAKKQLDIISKPQVSYAAKVINLAKYGFNYEDIEIGDTARVKDEEIGHIEARITQLITKPNNEEDEVVLGNFRDVYSERFIDTQAKITEFNSKSGVWDKTAQAFDLDGRLKGSYLKDILATFNNELNAAGGWTYAKPGEGIITYDKEETNNPTMATQLLAAGLRIANKKLANGSWDWQTAITAMGIVADVIYTGRIKGQTSYYDLDEGVLSFKASYKGKIIEVKMSIAGGFEIFEDGKKIGGLTVINNKVMLIANGMSNNPTLGYIEMGTVNYSQYNTPFTTQGMKIHYKESDKWHEIAIASHPSNTGLLFVMDGSLLCNFRTEGFYLESNAEFYGDKTQNKIIGHPVAITLHSATVDGNADKDKSTLSLGAKGEATLTGTKSAYLSKGGIRMGIDDISPYIGDFRIFKYGNGSAIVDQNTGRGIFFHKNNLVDYKYSNPSDPNSGTAVKNL